MLESLGSWPGAAWLQQSATVYLFINATHILGIGLLLAAADTVEPASVLQLMGRAYQQLGDNARAARCFAGQMPDDE